MNLSDLRSIEYHINNIEMANHHADPRERREIIDHSIKQIRAYIAMIRRDMTWEVK